MKLTADRLRELVHYNPHTGVFTWLARLAEGFCSVQEVRRWNTRYEGKPAGTLKPDGYMRIKVDDKPYSSHRLAILYVTGKWPQFDVDHVNGDRSDNRYSNLRDVPGQVNSQNERGPRQRNQVGLLGVSGVRNSNKFQARIYADGKKHHLGVFETAAEAHAAYVAAKRQLHEGCTL